MFIEDLRADFYNIILGKRVLVIANYDVDSICATRILSTLFHNDNTVYSVVPIMGLSSMQRAYADNREDAKYVVFINCGGSMDIVELLQPDEDVIFFVCDSHRPYDVCNIYNDQQVKLFGEHREDENIPAFEALFSDGEESDEDSASDDEDEDNGAPPESRIQKLERRMLKRREKRQWEEKRDRLLFEYSQYSFYGRSSAIIIFELAWKQSKDSLDLLWWAIVGATEQLILGKIDSSAYMLECEQIQSHIPRLTNRASDQNVQGAIKVNYENDLHLALYRHWTVYESLKHSVYPACKLKLWTLRGEMTLQEFLVEMGLPLVHAKQTFCAMDLELKREFFKMVEKLSAQYDMPHIVYGSYTLHYGYRNRYSAADYVYSIIAILESIKNEQTPEFCFLESLETLERKNRVKLDNGISTAKELLSAIFKQVQSSLELHQIHSAGKFLYYVLNEENPYFSFPYGLLLLSRFILSAHVSVSRNSRANELPLVTSCPIDRESGYCLVLGIPPVCEDAMRNFFGKAFEQAALKSNATILQDFFETSLIQIKQSDQARFLDALTVILS